MESFIGGVLAASVLWYIYVLYLQDEIHTQSFTLRKITSPLFQLTADKKVLYSLIYYTRLYQKSRRFNEELQAVIKEMWRDVRIKPSSIATRDLNTIMEEYRVERALLSRDWTIEDFPVVKIENAAKEEMTLANELSHEG